MKNRGMPLQYGLVIKACAKKSGAFAMPKKLTD